MPAVNEVDVTASVGAGETLSRRTAGKPKTSPTATSTPTTAGGGGGGKTRTGGTSTTAVSSTTEAKMMSAATAAIAPATAASTALTSSRPPRQQTAATSKNAATTAARTVAPTNRRTTKVADQEMTSGEGNPPTAAKRSLSMSTELPETTEGSKRRNRAQATNMLGSEKTSVQERRESTVNEGVTSSRSRTKSEDAVTSSAAGAAKTAAASNRGRSKNLSVQQQQQSVAPSRTSESGQLAVGEPLKKVRGRSAQRAPSVSSPASPAAVRTRASRKV